jgi:GWxTD domain-containing protein
MEITNILIIFISFLQFNYIFSYSLQNETANPEQKPSVGIIGLIEEGFYYYNQKKYTEAIKKFDEANRIKETAEANKGLGMSYLEKSKELESDNTLTYTTREMKKEDYLKLSIYYLQKALLLNPEKKEIQSILKEVYNLYYLTFKEKLPKSKPKSFEKSKIDLDNSAILNLITEGDSLYENKKYDVAIERYERANGLKETRDAYKGLGLSYIEKARELDKIMATPIRAERKEQYFKNSVKSFLKALTFEPNDIDIRYLLADAFIFRNRPEFDKLAELLLEQVTLTDKQYKDAMMKLSLVYRRLGKNEESKEVLNEYLKVKKVDSRTLYNLSKLALDEGKIEESAGFFMQSLDNLTDETAISEILEDLELIFSDKDKEEFRLAEHKGKLLKKFWLEKDPEPETEKNERLIEHMRRVKFAKENFVTQSTHGKYDDRGKIYIKYGDPDNKHISSGIPRIEDPTLGVSIEADGTGVYSNESWVYYWGIGNYNEGLFFDFVNKGGKGYELVGDLREAVYGLGHASSAGRNVNTYYALYKDREYLDDRHYGKIVRGMESGFFAGKNDRNLVEVRIDDEIFLYRDEKLIMEKNSPVEAYLYHTENQPIFLMTSSASFRGTGGRTRQEIYYSFPLNDIKFQETENLKTATFDESITLKNLENKNLYQDKRTIKLEYNKDQNVKNNSHIGQLNLEIPYQQEDYVSFLKIKSDTDKRLGLIYHEMNNKDYSGNSLILSDLEFSYNIVPSNEKNQFTKNGLFIIPHTGGIIDKDNDIFVYFEIYNLSLDSDGNARYKVDYTVKKRNPDDEKKEKIFDVLGHEIKNKKDKNIEKEIITISATEITKKKDSFSWTSVDMKNLSSGLYDFSIRITDLISNESVFSEYPFILGGK